MSSICMETGFVSLIKKGEELCGDRVATVNGEDCCTLVLADGLGSGVKANILSTLTAKIIATMMSNGLSVEECVSTIAQTLPVCKVRQIAYCTFTILQVSTNGDAYLVQFDNPAAILLRDGQSVDYDQTQKVICGKTIYESRFKVRVGDLFLLMSDGVIHAGVGEVLNFGWQRENVVEYAQEKYAPDISAKAMAAVICEACRDLYLNKPGDDSTVAALKVRRRQVVNLMIGPPADKRDDETMMQQFFSKGGKRIVCGGSTSQMVSRYLNKPIRCSIDYADPEIPPTAAIDGVDLVTEGVITIGKVLETARAFSSENDVSLRFQNKKDGASLISQLLFEEATDVNFFVGKAVNPSHQNPNLPININIKMELIQNLADCLSKMGKKVKVNFY